MNPRAVVWLFHLSLPLVGLWLLVRQPNVDLTWRHPPVIGRRTADVPPTRSSA